MKEHEKIQRLIYLLKLLSSNIGYSHKMLAEKIGVVERTIRRYINSCEKAGLVLNKTNGYFRLEKNTPHFREISSLLHFSDEEAVLLNEAINKIELNSTSTINLRNKLFALYNSDRINYPIIKKEDSGNVKLIIEAIRAKKQIRVINYKSSNSGTVMDRIVEPFDFTTNYIHIWAYENAYSKNFLFRVSRIENVEVLKDDWTNENNHKKGITDVFRMSGDTKTPFELKLTTAGYNYLIEQYPMAKQYIEKNKNNIYFLNHWYANFHGITKFILSAMDEVEIISNEKLRDYINNKIKNKIF